MKLTVVGNRGGRAFVYWPGVIIASLWTKFSRERFCTGCGKLSTQHCAGRQHCRNPCRISPAVPNSSMLEFWSAVSAENGLPLKIGHA